MSRNEDLAAFGISQSEDGVRLSQALPELLFDGLDALLSIDTDFACGVDDADLNLHEYQPTVGSRIPAPQSYRNVVMTAAIIGVGDKSVGYACRRSVAVIISVRFADEVGHKPGQIAGIRYVFHNPSLHTNSHPDC